ncbi:MAG: hypothetical protein ACI9EW_003701 [Cellvibrionaceae bacterium]|jgi:hypothetical protein
MHHLLLSNQQPIIGQKSLCFIFTDGAVPQILDLFSRFLGELDFPIVIRKIGIFGQIRSWGFFIGRFSNAARNSAPKAPRLAAGPDHCD